jgi:hypothetical protein
MVHRALVGPTLGLLLCSATALAQPAVPAPEEPGPSTENAVAATAPVNPDQAVYGMATRLRWVSVPHWLLNLFTDQNQALSAYGFAVEGFRRKGDLDVVLSLSYQKMGPPDGNWLGRGREAGFDTDYVQFRNFGFVGIDAAFIWRSVISEYMAFRYGAGLGLAIMTGQMLRTSSANCNPGNTGDLTACKPAVCVKGKVCTEDELSNSSKTGSIDNGPGEPHRFADDNVPGALPILNLVAGVDFHIPQAKGLELRLEGGFYDAFFLGMAVGYVF